MKKLVKKTQDGRLTEIDLKAMRREATELLEYVTHAPIEERNEFDYDGWLLPVVESALNGTLPIPYMEDPYNIQYVLEGILPELPPQLKLPYFRFLARIQGSASVSSASTIERGSYEPGTAEVGIDGERYEWVVFED